MTAPARADGAREPRPACGLTVEFRVHLRNGNRGRQRLRVGDAPAPPPVEPGNVPRISRLMALAIKFEGLIRSGAIGDCADLARLGHVSRARISQIMGLLNLAPDIQEEILFLPRTVSGKDAVTEGQLRGVVGVANWRQQRKMWSKLFR